LPAENGKLRSQSWFEGVSLYAFLHRTSMKAQGFAHDVWGEKPVIGICNSFSELTHCNAHLRLVAEAVKRGVWEAGGVPLEFPTISLGEPFIKPTTMMYRNLMAMDVEEMIKANPVDAVVLLGGCDKTVPAQLMGAASADLPAIMVTGGPMLSGNWRGGKVGSGTSAMKLWDEYRAGNLTEEEFVEVEGCLSRSSGHCSTMGTASTMTSLAEALGMTLPGSSSIPAVDSRRMASAQESGRRAVALVEEDLRPTRILTREALENAIRVSMAIGGSTNAVIHLIALAGRLGIELGLEDFDELSSTTPLLANVSPSGEYLMEDFFYAGGVPALMKQIENLLHLDQLTVSGRTVGENISGAETHDRDVIRPISKPLYPEGGTVVLQGNLAPNGAVLKQTAASPHLLVHRGPAVVFEDRRDLLNRIDDANLEVDDDSVLVLKNAGPRGGPGMPEWGHIPIPQKLVERGVVDMVRVSDARMSGTSYGTNVNHIAPESAVGGPLAAVQDGDVIELNVPERRIQLHVPEAEIRERLSRLTLPEPHYFRGYGRLFLDHVLQANEGCDFDFLKRNGGSEDDVAPRYAEARHV